MGFYVLLVFFFYGTLFISLHSYLTYFAALIVRFGLKDRDPNVRNECKSLVLKLLSDYKNDIPSLLNNLGFEEFEEETELLGEYMYCYGYTYCYTFTGFEYSFYDS